MIKPDDKKSIMKWLRGYNNVFDAIQNKFTNEQLNQFALMRIVSIYQYEKKAGKEEELLKVIIPRLSKVIKFEKEKEDKAK